MKKQIFLIIACAFITGCVEHVPLSPETMQSGDSPDYTGETTHYSVTPIAGTAVISNIWRNTATGQTNYIYALATDEVGALLINSLIETVTWTNPTALIHSITIPPPLSNTRFNLRLYSDKNSNAAFDTGMGENIRLDQNMLYNSGNFQQFLWFTHAKNNTL